jgi:hypothetical protein
VPPPVPAPPDGSVGRAAARHVLGPAGAVGQRARVTNETPLVPKIRCLTATTTADEYYSIFSARSAPPRKKNEPVAVFFDLRFFISLSRTAYYVPILRNAWVLYVSEFISFYVEIG